MISELCSAEDKLKSLEESLANLTTDYNNLRNTTSSSTENVDELRTQLAVKNDQLNTIAKDNEALKLELESVENQLVRLEILQKNTSSQFDDLTAEHGKLQHSLASLETEHQNVKMERDTALSRQYEVHEKQEKVLEVENLLKQETASKLTVESELTVVAAKVKELESTLQEKENSLKVAEAERDGAKDGVTVKENECKRLQEKFSNYDSLAGIIVNNNLFRA